MKADAVPGGTGTERRVLVFPAGTEIALEIRASLVHCRGIRTFGAGEDVSNPGRFAFEHYDVVPRVGEPGWLEALAEICERRAIDCIFPAHDDAVLALARARAQLPRVIASPQRTCEILRSKRATYEWLRSDVRVPQVHEPTQVREFPVFVKPDRGQGSLDARRVDSPSGLEQALAGTRDPIVTEFLPGEEFTVDCFSCRRRGVLFAGARRRLRMRNGIAVNTRTVELPEARAIAEAIGARLELHGAWFFQLRRARDGALTLLEAAPRIAGAMATHRVLGVNFALLSILESEGMEVRVQAAPAAVELDRCLRNRYRHGLDYDSLYIDLDDTLIENGRVNLDAIRLVYQCINRGRPVVLVTRHAGDLGQTLARHRLAGLFDRIVHLRAGEPKSDSIDDAGAIYVDDSFSERMDVERRRGIRTFDGSMLELLIDEAASQEVP